MKKTLALFTGILFIACLAAQSPQSIPYQAVVRNASGNLVVSQQVSFRFTIHDGSTGGTIVYQEIQSGTAVKTNNLGLVTVQVGGGTPVGSYTFSAINWGTNAKFMDVELDPAGGTSYTDMGTSQMMSVPYALYAGSAGTATSVSGTTPSGGIIMYSGAWNFDGTGLGTGSLAGWALCNGNNSTPNLTEQFIMGAASSVELSTTGGATTHTHAIPALTVPAVAVTGTIPALSVASEAVTGNIPALTVPAEGVTGTIPALTVPAEGVTGTIPALTVPAEGVTGTIPALTVASENISGTIPPIGVTGTIPGLSVPLGYLPVEMAGTTTTAGVNSTTGYFGLGSGNAVEYYGGSNAPRVISTGGGGVNASYIPFQLQNPTVTSTASSITSGTTVSFSLASGHLTTAGGTTTASSITSGTTAGGSTTASSITAGTTAGGSTTASAITGGTTAGGSTTASAITGGTTAGGSTGTGSLVSGTTAAGSTSSSTTGSASSLPPYFKLAFIMKQ